MARENEGIPKQVLEADKNAREFIESLGADAEESSEGSEETDENQEAEEEESEEEEEGEKAESEESEEEESEESSEDEDDEKDEDDDEETWQQRYKSLKGMYDKDVPRLNQELRELKSEVFERLGQLTVKAEDADAGDEAAADEMPEDIAAFVDEMGPEYIGNLNRYMEFMFGPMLDKGLQPVAEKVNDVEDATVKGAQKQFSDYLDTKVEGDWQALMQGEDEGFIEFLQQPDPSGLYTYGQLIKLYNDNWDADKLATVLNSYLGVESKSGEEETVKKTQKSNKQKTTVAPNRKKPTSAVTDNEPRIWTQADIKQFEKDERRGNVYDEETSKAMWRDLMAAGNEGRIRD